MLLLLNSYKSRVSKARKTECEAAKNRLTDLVLTPMIKVTRKQENTQLPYSLKTPNN